MVIKVKFHIVIIAAIFSLPAMAENYGDATGLAQNKFRVVAFTTAGSSTWTAPYTGMYLLFGCGAGGGGGGGHSTAGGGGGGGSAECLPGNGLAMLFQAGDTLTITNQSGGVGGTGGASPTAGSAGTGTATIIGGSYSDGIALFPGQGGSAGTGVNGGAGGNSAGAFLAGTGGAAGANAAVSTHVTNGNRSAISSGAGGGTTAVANGWGRSMIGDFACRKNNGASNNEGGAGGGNIFQVWTSAHSCSNYGGEAGENAATVPAKGCGLGGGGGGGGAPGGNGATGGNSCFFIGYGAN